MVSSRSNLDNNRDDTSFTDEIQTENLMKKPRGSCGVFPCILMPERGPHLLFRPAPPGSPVLGSFVQFMFSFQSVCKRLFEKFPKRCTQSFCMISFLCHKCMTHNFHVGARLMTDVSKDFVGWFHRGVGNTAKCVRHFDRLCQIQMKIGIYLSMCWSIEIIIQNYSTQKKVTVRKGDIIIYTLQNKTEENKITEPFHRRLKLECRQEKLRETLAFHL